MLTAICGLQHRAPLYLSSSLSLTQGSFAPATTNSDPYAIVGGTGKYVTASGYFIESTSPTTVGSELYDTFFLTIYVLTPSVPAPTSGLSPVGSPGCNSSGNLPNAVSGRKGPATEPFALSDLSERLELFSRLTFVHPRITFATFLDCIWPLQLVPVDCNHTLYIGSAPFCSRLCSNNLPRSC